MPFQFAGSPLFITAAAFGLLGAGLIIHGIVTLPRKGLLQFAFRTLLGLLLLALGGLAGTIVVGIQGYQALTREEVAAHILITPITAQHFSATFHYPDGRTATFAIRGDDIYVDAHILKWKPWANIFGLHTVYQLDRVAGRYHSIEREKYAERTIHSLAQESPVDIFSLRQRYAFLAPFVDATYGSATFLSITQPAKLELNISTTGLLMREVPMLRKAY